MYGTVQISVCRTVSSLCIALVLPVTSAACERSFSSFKLIKTLSEKHDVRRSIERYCRVVNESKRSQAIDFDAVVDQFDARHQNRKLALH